MNGFTAGLNAETPIIMDNELSTIRRLYMLGNSVESICLDNNIKVCNTNIFPVPQIIYHNELHELVFSNGAYLNCTPNTMIFTSIGYVMAKDLNKNSKIININFNSDTGKFEYTHIGINKSNESIKSLATECYYFISDANNILMPYYNNKYNEISFICIHQ